MAPRKTAPYGTWESPISADLLTQKTIRIDDILVDSVTSKVYHVESRPDEKGRNVVVDSVSGKDAFGSGFNARTSAQEYGGSCTAMTSGKLIFSNYTDNGLYLVDTNSSSKPVKVTPDKDVWKYADFSVHPHHPNLVVSVLEDHTRPEPTNIVTTLVVINVETKSVKPLMEGADFYSSPLISPDGKHISFVQWFHPDMPWEGGETVVAPISLDENGMKITGDLSIVAGKRGQINSQQPEWISSDKLIVLADQHGFLNPYIYTLSTGKLAPVLSPVVNEDFGEPGWNYGNSSYAILDNSHVLLSSIRNDTSTLYLVDLDTGSFKDLNTPYVGISRIRRISDDAVVFAGRKLDEAQTLVQFTIFNGSYRVLKQTSNVVDTLPDGIVSRAQPLKLGPENKPVYCTYYPPRNPDYMENEEEKPPCIVSVHGGPSGRVGQGLVWSTQYFTSRGFGWLDVNYGGSTGYGREYVDRLRGQWGIVDVNDTAECVKQVIAKGLVDGKRVVIRGGSAGGFTVLLSLAQHPDLFAAGNSLFGVADLRKLLEDMIKFESRYIERLVGGTPESNPQAFRDRSPIFQADKIRSPLLVLQGSIDKVVPPVQSKEIVRVIKEKGGVVKYVEYEGEGHGWRQAATIKNAMEEEVSWYRKAFGLSSNAD